MNTDDISTYDYELPEELIAAHPSETRTESRLLVADRGAKRVAHQRFGQLPEHLETGDLLVFNDTEVVPARIACRKETGGAVELLVIDVRQPAGDERWTGAAAGELELECMTRSSKRLRPGMALHIEGATDLPAFEVLTYEAGIARVRIAWEQSAVALLDRVGEIPLPPYIVRRRESLGESAAQREDRKRYQTVYARRPGAVAAPTAGLHFTPELLDELDSRGIRRAFVTLRVGPGTFRPVTADRLSEHEMHFEEYTIGPEVGAAIAATREAGRRVVAVGTTTVRTLEAEALRDQPFEPGTRSTNLFIRPGSKFGVVDAMITNFHLPRSTLLALVGTFTGIEFMHEIYREAIAQRYRFYSYGDATLIL